MAVAKRRIIQTKGRKKTAVARATLSSGTGIFKMNGSAVSVFKPAAAADIISEPIILAQKCLGNDFASRINIQVNTQGGGIMGQVYAARTAIGKALVEWGQNEDLKKYFLEYDRSLLVDDIRKKESKKYLRKGARAKPIKSYR